MVPAACRRRPLVSSVAVSKRTRGTGRPVRHRPGARPPSARPASALRPARPLVDDIGKAPAGIDSGPPLRAAETIPGDSPAVGTSSPAVGTREPDAVGAGVRPPPHSAHHRLRAKPGSLLAARAESEYIYVGQDLRRISLVAALLAAILIGLWVVLVLLGVSPLY